MADESSSQEGIAPILRFACSCVSAAAVTDEPWSNVSKHKRFDDGTKELILNAVHRRPRTIAQLATGLGISQPAVHRHVSDLLACELLREVSVPEADRRSVVERYYAPNFRVLLRSDRQQLVPVLEAVASELAEVFRRRQESLVEAYSATSLQARVGGVEGLGHWFFTAAVRIARERLEEEGILPKWPEHGDGSQWLWWAEEPLDDEAARLWETR
jgi:DNA-binding transcriptional ArsR family regulator